MPDALYQRSKSFDASAGAYADADGIKTSIATAAAIATYVTSALNGTSTVGKAIAAGSQAAFASWPTVTNTSAVGSYVASSTVAFTGTWGGAVTTRTATITSADGGATYIADGPLDHGSISKIVVAAQVDTAGAFTFGWTGVGPKKGYAWLLVARETGTLVVTNEDGADDSFVLAAHGQHLCLVTRIYAAVTIDVTVYETSRA